MSKQLSNLMKLFGNFIIMICFVTGAVSTSSAVSISVNLSASLPPNVRYYASNNTAIMADRALTLRVLASDPNGPGAADDGTITMVEFYRDGIKVGESTTAPYTYTWPSTVAGTHKFTAKAFDNDGLSTESKVINIIVHPAGFFTNKEYYVKQGASNANNGLSPATPFPTIQKAADLTNPGDIVYVMQGEYKNAFPTGNVVSINRTGTADHWIEYKAYKDDKPRLKFNGWQGFLVDLGAAYIKISGFEIEGNNENINLADAKAQPGSCEGSNPTGSPSPIYNGNGISVDGRNGGNIQPHHIVIANNKVHDCGGLGVGAIESDYITIDNNEIYNTSWYTIYGTSGISIFHPWNYDDNVGYRNIVRNNIIYGNILLVKWAAVCDITDGNGIILDDFLNSQSTSTIRNQLYTGRTLVYNNVVYNNGGAGITSYKGLHIDIINNTAYQNSRSVETKGEIFAVSSTDINLYNNIIYAIKDEPANNISKNKDVVYNYNLYFNTTDIKGKGANDVIGDPTFVNPSIGDFRLLPGSPAINKGTSAYLSSVPTDLLGVVRPQDGINDIGAYEGSVANQPPKVNLTSPTTGNSFSVGATISLSATATDTDGSISKVEFYQGSVKLGEATTAPYQFNWTNVPAGSYSLTAKAYDNEGKMSTSTAVTVTVVASVVPDFILQATPLASPLNTDRSVNSTVLVQPLNGFTGLVNFTLSGLPAGVTGIFSPASVSNSGSSTLTLTADSNAQPGEFVITLTGTAGTVTRSIDLFLKVVKPAVVADKADGLKPQRVFSPNNDGINDVWGIEGIEQHPDYQVAIYDRYGQRLYQASPYVNDWDGTFKGQPLPVEAYYFVIRDGSGKVLKASSVTLLR